MGFTGLRKGFEEHVYGLHVGMTGSPVFLEALFLSRESDAEGFLEHRLACNVCGLGLELDRVSWALECRGSSASMVRGKMDN